MSNSFENHIPSLFNILRCLCNYIFKKLIINTDTPETESNIYRRNYLHISGRISTLFCPLLMHTQHPIPLCHEDDEGASEGCNTSYKEERVASQLAIYANIDITTHSIPPHLLDAGLGSPQQCPQPRLQPQGGLPVPAVLRLHRGDAGQELGARGVHAVEALHAAYRCGVR